MNTNRPLPLLVVLVLALALGACAPTTEEVPLASAATPRVTATRAPTFTPVPTATPEPTLTPKPTFTPEPTPTFTPQPTPTVEVATTLRQVLLSNITHDYQRLNNCGPTTAAMTLSYYGVGLTQYDIAPIVKGAATDKNVSPEELSAFVQAQGFAAPIRVNGDLALLRSLLANGIPVIVEQWLERPDDALTGHYRLVRGYDQDAGVFVINDSYLGPNLRYSEADFDRWWRAFNRLYIPVYRPEQEPLVQALVGARGWETTAMWQGAQAQAEKEVATSPDVYGWFNLGSARLRLGDTEGAVVAFEEAIARGLPQRMLWYQFTPLEALNATGEYERALQISQPFVGFQIEEIHYHRGLAWEGLGRPQDALAEYRAAVSFNPHFTPVLEALARLGG